MAFSFNARIDDAVTRVEFEGGTAALEIIDSEDNGWVSGETNSIYFLIKDGELIYVGKTGTGSRDHSKKDFDQYIIISAPRGIDINYLEMFYIQLAEDYGIKLINKVKPSLPKNITKNKRLEAEDFAKDVQILLDKFGFDFFSPRRYTNSRERSLVIGNTRIDMIGNCVEIYIDGKHYEGNKINKLHEIATSAGVNYSTWKPYRQKGAISFALELAKYISTEA